ncbi:MAG: hypothetical protein JSR17_01635 [Proteobacteria bacterium]|nr:hypothetical protein [Pseudomonadota bacterium]
MSIRKKKNDNEINNVKPKIVELIGHVSLQKGYERKQTTHTPIEEIDVETQNKPKNVELRGYISLKKGYERKHATQKIQTLETNEEIVRPKLVELRGHVSLNKGYERKHTLLDNEEIKDNVRPKHVELRGHATLQKRYERKNRKLYYLESQKHLEEQLNYLERNDISNNVDNTIEKQEKQEERKEREEKNKESKPKEIIQKFFPTKHVKDSSMSHQPPTQPIQQLTQQPIQQPIQPPIQPIQIEPIQQPIQPIQPIQPTQLIQPPTQPKHVFTQAQAQAQAQQPLQIQQTTPQKTQSNNKFKSKQNVKNIIADIVKQIKTKDNKDNEEGNDVNFSLPVYIDVNCPLLNTHTLLITENTLEAPNIPNTTSNTTPNTTTNTTTDIPTKIVSESESKIGEDQVSNKYNMILHEEKLTPITPDSSKSIYCNNTTTNTYNNEKIKKGMKKKFSRCATSKSKSTDNHVSNYNWYNNGYKIDLYIWKGRLGNNIVQLCHAIFVALRSKSTIQNIPSHNIINSRNLHKLNFASPKNANQPKFNEQIIKHDFFRLEKICTRWRLDPITEVNICQKYILPRLELTKQNIPTVNCDIQLWENTLVIHMREGDIFKKYPDFAHPKYTQPPFAFYKKILDKHVFSQILILTESGMEDINPCKYKIIDYCKNKNIPCFCQSTTLENDAATLLSAKHIALSRSTLSEWILRCNKYCDTVYCPVFPNAITDKKYIQYAFFVPQYKLFEEYILENYIPIGGWTSHDDQKELMINYSEEHIKCVSYTNDNINTSANESSEVEEIKIQKKHGKLITRSLRKNKKRDEKIQLSVSNGVIELEEPKKMKEGEVEEPKQVVKVIELEWADVEIEETREGELRKEVEQPKEDSKEDSKEEQKEAEVGKEIEEHKDVEVGKEIEEPKDVEVGKEIEEQKEVEPEKIESEVEKEVEVEEIKIEEVEVEAEEIKVEEVEEVEEIKVEEVEVEVEEIKVEEVEVEVKEIKVEEVEVEVEPEEIEVEEEKEVESEKAKQIEVEAEVVKDSELELKQTEDENNECNEKIEEIENVEIKQDKENEFIEN